METTSVHNVFCLPRKTTKLHMYTHSNSFRYAKQHKGGRVRSFGGFTWLPIDKKASSLSSKNLRNFFLVLCSCQMKLDTCEQFWLPST